MILIKWNLLGQKSRGFSLISTAYNLRNFSHPVKLESSVFSRLCNPGSVNSTLWRTRHYVLHKLTKWSFPIQKTIFQSYHTEIPLRLLLYINVIFASVWLLKLTWLLPALFITKCRQILLWTGGCTKFRLQTAWRTQNIWISN